MKDVPVSTVVLVAALAGAAGFALGRSTSPAPAEPISQAPSPPPNDMPMMGGNDLPPGHPNVQGQNDLPPNHPSVQGDMPSASAASITWTAPARWVSVPNPSSMRIATYKIPRAQGDTDDAELSITQAGGGVDANIDRWVGQFEGGQAKRTSKTVKGMKVTIVEIGGTYSGGMSGGGPQKGWALLGGIVETKDMPHFFKITGPEKTVKAARTELETMLDSIAPKS